MGFKTAWTKLVTRHDIPWLIPVQILDILIKQILPIKTKGNNLPLKSPPVTPSQFSPISLLEDPKGILLSSLKRIIPHSWSETPKDLHNNKVAKNDNAKAEISLWDKRILLLFKKASHHHLQVLRTFFLRQHKRNFTKEVCALYSLLDGSGERSTNSDKKTQIMFRCYPNG